MKRIVIWILVLALMLSGCGMPEQDPTTQSGWILLLGEDHGRASYMEAELEQWQFYYEEHGMRHLFVEFGYCSAQILNLWMQSEDDAWLELWFENLQETEAYVEATMKLMRGIKDTCPETVFHGTDVEHQYRTTGAAYIAYLEENGQRESEQYILAQEGIEQAKTFYRELDWGYREQCMVDNFVREFESLNGESVMGIYGAVHAAWDGATFNYPDVPCMANQLKNRYVDQVVCWDVFSFVKLRKEEVQTISVSGREFGARLVKKVQGYAAGMDAVSRSCWILEESGEPFTQWKGTGEYLSMDECPAMRLGSVIVVEIEKKDGSKEQIVYRCDGGRVDGKLAAERIGTADK